MLLPKSNVCKHVKKYKILRMAAGNSSNAVKDLFMLSIKIMNDITIYFLNSHFQIRGHRPILQYIKGLDITIVHYNHVKRIPT